MVMQDDLHKDIKVLYETENMANIIDENRQGWVPKNCIVIDDIPAYCGNLSKHEAEEKLALAPDNACLLYTEKRKTGNFVLFAAAVHTPPPCGAGFVDIISVMFLVIQISCLVAQNPSRVKKATNPTTMKSSTASVAPES